MLRCHILPRFSKIHMDKITPQAISDFHHGMIAKGLAKGTANRRLVLLKYMFNLAIKWQIPGITFNPAAGVKLFEANNARIAAGLPDVRVHDLRHSCASFMINNGRSIYEVSSILGHSQLKTTQRYAHLSQETLLEAVDAAAEATGTDWGQ